MLVILRYYSCSQQGINNLHYRQKKCKINRKKIEANVNIRISLHMHDPAMVIITAAVLWEGENYQLV